jgi:ABC-type sugar transport system substrate-binding protein
MMIRRTATLLVATGLTVAILAGCGSSGSSSTSAGPASKRAVTAADKAYASYLDPDPPLNIEKVTGTAPTGKTMDVITCPVAICSAYTEGAKQAAEALGWSTKVLVSQFSPTSYQSVWNKIVQDKPDVVFVASITPLSVVSQQVLQAKANGAKLVAYGIPEDVGPGASSEAARAFEINMAGPAEEAQQGRVEALQAIHDSQGAPNVLVLTDPSIPTFAFEVAAEKKALEAVGAEVAVVDVSQADIGSSLPATVARYLRAHPDVQYVTVPIDDYGAGVPQAIESAGLGGKVKLIGSAASDSSQKLVAEGQVFASTVHPTQANAWYMVDAAVRAFTGDRVADANPAGPISILTKETSEAVGSAATWPSSIYAKFRQAWGVSE